MAPAEAEAIVEDVPMAKLDLTEAEQAAIDAVKAQEEVRQLLHSTRPTLC